MTRDRWLMDTLYVQALLNPRDHYHSLARQFMPRVRNASEIWVTEAVLMEVGNALAELNRHGAVEFIRDCYRTPNVYVVTISPPLFSRGVDLYEARPDKEWGLVDCISFTVMQDQRLTEALTADHHFQQAGYRALLLDPPRKRRARR